MPHLTAATVRSVNPATLDVVGEAPVASTEEIAAAVAGARAAQRHWNRVSAAERRRLFAALQDVLLDRADQIAATVTAETGKPLLEAYSQDIFIAAESVRWTPRAAERVLRPRRLTAPLLVGHKRPRILREPLGVVGIVSPWNYPVAVPFTQSVSAVAAGNGVVLKPSELTPLSGNWVARLFAEAGFPSGLVAAVHGGRDTGAALVTADGVDKVVFTGSGETGRAVAAEAAPLLRPVTLELGGKDPLLVFADADRERSLAGALWGSFTNCGQVCAGAERIYVERSVFEDFTRTLAAAARSLVIGNGGDPVTDLGPLITEPQRERVEGIVADALDHGAELVTGGRRPGNGLPGWFLEPTVLAGERIGGRIAEEELFGPVVTVEPFDDEDEAIELANASPFGLGASVWTQNGERMRRVAARLEAGAVWMNDLAYSYFVAKAPWGGTKGSGHGRTHGEDGLRALTRSKYVDHDSGWLPVPWWYPYRPEALEGLRGGLELLYRSGVGARGRGAARRWGGIAHLAKRYVGRS